MKRQEIYVETIKDQIYQILKDEIINCTLKSGEKLVEQTIADRMNVSRSPVREAIKQLTGDGLVENTPNKGAFVKKPTFKDILDMYDVRKMFEVYAVQKIGTNMKKPGEQQLRRLRENIQKAYQNKNIKGYHVLERELSNTIIALSGNQVVMNSYGNLYTMMSNFSDVVLDGKDQRFHETVQERLDLIDALLSGDTASAEKIVTQHLDQAKEWIRKIIEGDAQ